jgi:hypothetical protein
MAVRNGTLLKPPGKCGENKLDNLAYNVGIMPGRINGLLDVLRHHWQLESPMCHLLGHLMGHLTA